MEGMKHGKTEEKKEGKEGTKGRKRRLEEMRNDGSAYEVNQRRRREGGRRKWTDQWIILGRNHFHTVDKWIHRRGDDIDESVVVTDNSFNPAVDISSRGRREDKQTDGQRDRHTDKQTQGQTYT